MTSTRFLKWGSSQAESSFPFNIVNHEIRKVKGVWEPCWINLNNFELCYMVLNKVRLLSNILKTKFHWIKQCWLMLGSFDGAVVLCKSYCSALSYHNYHSLYQNPSYWRKKYIIEFVCLKSPLFKLDRASSSVDVVFFLAVVLTLCFQV